MSERDPDKNGIVTSEQARQRLAVLQLQTGLILRQQNTLNVMLIQLLQDITLGENIAKERVQELTAQVRLLSTEMDSHWEESLAIAKKIVNHNG